MASEIFHWARDLSRYVVEIGHRWRIQQTGQGVDYTSDEYRESVARVVSRLHPKRMRLKVSEIIEETSSAKTFRFTRADAGFPPFRAGQYVNLFVEVDGVATSRPYSISSTPGHDHLDLTVRLKKEDGFVSPHLLDNVAVGDELDCSGPTGQFYFEPLIDRGGLVFLAGGSGITPFMSMVRHQVDRGWETPIYLVYGSRVPDDVIFGDEMKALASEHSAFSYLLVVSEPPKSYRGTSGFITADLIRRHVGEIDGRTFFICGPNNMYTHCSNELEELGVAPHRIRRELFGPPDDVTAEPGWPAGVKGTDVFEVRVDGRPPNTVRAGEPLMNAFERNGIVVEALCRSGQCSYCRLRVLSGEVFALPQTGLRESDRRAGYIHACTSYPVSDLEIGL